MTKTCATCQAYQREADSQSGICRRYVPEHGKGWPDVHETDWCLEWVGPDPVPRAGGKREFPDDFMPTDQHYALAEQLGVNLGEQLGLMASWAKSNGEKKKDWNQTLSNWLRNAKLKQRLHFR